MALNPYTNKRVCVITVEGHTIVGTLISSDQVTNMVLKDTVERVIRPSDDEEPSEEITYGLYMLRGDNVVLVGLVDEELDGKIDWTKVHADAIGTTKHV